jgi:hypothetical protein
VPTAHTPDIFEEEQLLTVCTMKNVHALILVQYYLMRASAVVNRQAMVAQA